MMMHEAAATASMRQLMRNVPSAFAPSSTVIGAPIASEVSFATQVAASASAGAAPATQAGRAAKRQRMSSEPDISSDMADHIAIRYNPLEASVINSFRRDILASLRR